MMNISMNIPPDAWSLLGAVVAGIAFVDVVAKILTKIRANRRASEALRHARTKAELNRFAKSLRIEHLDPIEREKILKHVEQALQALDAKTRLEIFESLNQRSSRGRVRYAQDLLRKSTEAPEPKAAVH
jgi:hypothetical protein